ncbi:winged helix-turn-helix domain-containing protein [Streptomyces mirabilis]|uniref:winged helix-turn-helix domain-containing protein n=1 Tax=Streptomyces mirabilis TaxID=68239 RepID=UPI0036C32355
MSGTRSERLHATRVPGDPTRGERPGGHRVPGERVLDDGDGARVRGERDGGERLCGGRDGGERPRVGHDGGEYVHGAGVRGGREGGDRLRLRGLLRRAGAEPLRADDSVLVLGDLVLSEETREVRRDGTPIQLTAKEFDLLGLLLGHPHQVLSKAQILDHVWSSSFDGGGNLVEVYISSLRRKIDKGRPPTIHTVRGVGYAIRPVEDGR